MPEGGYNKYRYPTHKPTLHPTHRPYPTKAPTHRPSRTPTSIPTQKPTRVPTSEPTKSPTENPSTEPTDSPTPDPSSEPTAPPSEASSDPLAPDAPEGGEPPADINPSSDPYAYDPIVPIIGRRSAVETGADGGAQELGGEKYDLVRNPYSWSESAHMLFLEQPIRCRHHPE